MFVLALPFLAILAFLVGILIYKIVLHRRGKRLLLIAKANEGMFYVNGNRDVTGICTQREFLDALLKYEDCVDNGFANLWDPIVYRPRNVFTFAKSEETRRPIHCGVQSDLTNFIELVMAKISGLAKGEVRPKQYAQAVKIVFHKDRRLYVPFSGPSANGEKEFKYYGRRSHEEAIEALSSGIKVEQVW